MEDFCANSGECDFYYMRVSGCESFAEIIRFESNVCKHNVDLTINQFKDMSNLNAVYNSALGKKFDVEHAFAEMTPYYVGSIARCGNYCKKIKASVILIVRKVNTFKIIFFKY